MRLVLRRLLNDLLLGVAASATVLLALTMLAMLTGYTAAVSNEGLTRSLENTTFQETGTRVYGRAPKQGLVQTDDRVRQLFKNAYREVPAEVNLSARSTLFGLPGRRGQAKVALIGGIERHAALTGGRWPGAGGGIIEAALSDATARAMNVKVGDEFTVRNLVDQEQVRVRIIGTFRPNRPDAPLWSNDRLILEGIQRLETTSFGPIVVSPETFTARFTRQPADSYWLVTPDLRSVEPDEVGGLAERIGPELNRALSMQGFTSTSYLHGTLDRLNTALTVTRSTMLVPALQLLLLACYALILVARLMSEQRRSELSLFRARGASVRDLAALALGEGLLLVLPGALLGPLLAPPLLRLVAKAPSLEAAGVRLETTTTPLIWTATAVAALVCVLALTVPAIANAARTYVAVQSLRGRGQKRGVLQRAGGDVALVVVAGLGLWQLVRYGAPVTRTAGTGRLGIDPFIVSGPALGLMAGGAMLLRSAPVLSAVVEKVAVRGQGFAPAVGIWQVSRRPLRHLGPALLLVMAVAVGILSVVTTATWRDSQRAQADFQAGPSLRITTPTVVPGPLPLGQGGALAAQPGVSAVSPVARDEPTVSNQRVTVLAMDTTLIDRLLDRGPRLPVRLDTVRAAAVPPLPGRPTEIRIGVQAKGRAPGLEAGRFPLAATIVDSRGVGFRADLGFLPPDGVRHDFMLTTDDLAGARGGLSPPLTVQAIHYQYPAEEMDGDLRLTVLEIRGDQGPFKTTPGVAWQTAVTSRADPVEVAVTRPAGAVFSTVLPRQTPDLDGTLVPFTMNAVLTAGAPRTEQPPVIISAALAEQTKTKVGDRLVLLAGGVLRQPLRVAGIVRAVPSTEPGVPALIVDLPTLTQRLITAGEKPVHPTEWWVAADDTSRVVSAVSGWHASITDREELHNRTRNAPLGAALLGALLMGFLAALAFIIIGFAVNSAVSARERVTEFAIMRALGAGPRQLFGLMAVEQIFLVVLGLFGGTALGLFVSRFVVPNLVVTVRAQAPYPPVELQTPWPPILALVCVVLVVLAGLLGLLLAALRRRGLSQDLRFGEDA